jgi:D-glycero-D-manno-heptose 1,7-bisphosphate phosphatase
MKAIFLDRDGVINKDVGYLHQISEFSFIDGTIEALQYLSSKNFLLFIITNQSGIARGYYSEADFEVLSNWLLSFLKKKKIIITEILHCPHITSDNCNCRKPNTGMIDEIKIKYEIDIENSWIIGDKKSDIDCGLKSGINNTIQVRSGHYFDDSESNAKYILNSIKEINSII